MDLLPWILLTLIFSAFFTGMETAFIYSNKMSLEIARKQNTISSRIITIFSDNKSQFILSMLVCNLISLIIYTSLFYFFISSETILFGFQSNLLNTILILLLSVFLYLFISELLPRIIFRYIGNYSLKVFALPLAFFYYLFYPLVRLFIRFTEKISGKIFINDLLPPDKEAYNDAAGNVSPESEEIPNDEVNNNDVKIFLNALDFGNIKTKECMVPRTDIVAQNKEVKMDDLTRKFIETGFSKILIIENSIDKVLGYVSSHDLFESPDSVTEMIKNLPVVPEMMTAQDLLKFFIAKKRSIALVVDEFGGTAGLVSIEDVLEEIFGEIEDEYDTVNLVERKLTDGSFIFSGRQEIDYINEKYGIYIEPSDEYETIAGFILNKYGNIPPMGEVMYDIAIEGDSLKILKTSNTRIELVKYIPAK